MHSLEQELLTHDPMAKELQKIIGRTSNSMFHQVGFGFVDNIFEEIKDTNRGAPNTYKQSMKFKSILLALKLGARSIRGISRKVKGNTTRVYLRMLTAKMPSYSTIERFIKAMIPLLDKILQELVKILVRLGLIGNVFVLDGTDIETRFEDDPDAKWNYDATRKRYYYGYGLALVIESKNQLPVAIQFRAEKKMDTESTIALTEKAIALKRPFLFLGDSEFDIIEFQRGLLDIGIIPIIDYNPRNTKEPKNIRFRVQELVTEINPNMEVKEKDIVTCYKDRISVERGIGDLKKLGLNDLPWPGRMKAMFHVYMIVMMRLLNALETYLNNPDANLRRITNHMEL